jgi:predicted enzyme related to lactoylglutathione lyase
MTSNARRKEHSWHTRLCTSRSSARTRTSSGTTSVSCSAGSALAEAERLGGKRQMGPERAPTGLVVGHFTDPEGNLIGVAGTA